MKIEEVKKGMEGDKNNIIIFLKIATNFSQLYFVLRGHKNNQGSKLVFTIISVTFHSELYLSL